MVRVVQNSAAEKQLSGIMLIYRLHPWCNAQNGRRGNDALYYIGEVQA